ncbi:MAG: HAD-IIIA family hydrolase [Cyclobacteriaceae bacterium]|nr:HAD-IIIA family hydrolase [Cyclobacteriaceae bacterium HetDA_MAG_MS6]
MNKVIFLDRDGVLNVERGAYTFQPEDFIVVDGIVPVLNELKRAGYLLIVITNQAGIRRGIYTTEQMHGCHQKFQEASDHLIDAFYYAPGHPDYSASLSRKPGSLLFEKAIAKFNIDPGLSWMIGDKERDILPAKKLGIRTILVSGQRLSVADHQLTEVVDIPKIVLGNMPIIDNPES